MKLLFPLFLISLVIFSLLGEFFYLLFFFALLNFLMICLEMNWIFPYSSSLEIGRLLFFPVWRLMSLISSGKFCHIISLIIFSLFSFFGSTIGWIWISWPFFFKASFLSWSPHPTPWPLGGINYANMLSKLSIENFFITMHLIFQSSFFIWLFLC